jgi:hypothetical protein
MHDDRILTCACASLESHGNEPDISGLNVVRRQCPALNQLLAPDDAWDVIAADAAHAPNKALHRSCLLLAYQRGKLHKLTAPIHHFLLNSDRLRPSVTSQYRKDLQEHRWLLQKDEMSRHEKFRIFWGKLVESQVAEWLASQGWTVTELEALGYNCDIVALSEERLLHSIEVKYVDSTMTTSSRP